MVPSFLADSRVVMLDFLFLAPSCAGVLDKTQIGHEIDHFFNSLV